MRWAQNLRGEDIEKVELVGFGNVESERYHLYRPEEYPEIVELVNSSHGSHVSKSVSTTGYLTYFYITTKDGVRHKFVNCKNNYLIIDGDVYDAELRWLLDWSLLTGDAPLPEGFLDGEDIMLPVITGGIASDGGLISQRCLYMSPLSSIFPPMVTTDCGILSLRTVLGL